MNDNAHADDVVLTLPPSAPRMPQGRVSRWLGRSALRLGGWRMVGAFPDVPKLVIIVAPHSSNWDGLWAFAAKVGMGVKLSILGKHSLMRVPVLGGWLRSQGVIPVNRHVAHGVTAQATAALRDATCMWYALAPEGTRQRVEHWKPGFWHIATGAGVPVVLAYIDYPSRTIGIGEVVTLTDDMHADIARIQRWYAPIKGRNHDVVSPD